MRIWLAGVTLVLIILVVMSLMMSADREEAEVEAPAPNRAALQRAYDLCKERETSRSAVWRCIREETR